MGGYDPEARIAPGRVPVVLDIEDDLSADNLPAGSAARMAVWGERAVPPDRRAEPGIWAPGPRAALQENMARAPLQRGQRN
jgi:hypothetical protein